MCFLMWRSWRHCELKDTRSDKAHLNTGHAVENISLPQSTHNHNPVLNHFYRHARYWLKQKKKKKRKERKRKKVGTQLLLSGNYSPIFYSNYYCGHPRIYRFRPLGSLQFSLEHCLGSPCHAIIIFVLFCPTPHIIYDLTLIDCLVFSSRLLSYTETLKTNRNNYYWQHTHTQTQINKMK